MIPFGADKPLLDTGGIQLTTSVVTVLTPPSGLNVSVKVLYVTVNNTSGSARTYSIWRVPPGGTAIDSTIIGGKAIPIAANTHYGIAVEWNVPQGWTLQAQADGNTAVTLSFDGKLFQ